MRPRLALSLALALAGGGPPAAEAATPCKGTLSGSLQGKFDCTASVVERDGTWYFVIEARTRIDGVPGYSPGSWELAEAPRARTYGMDELGMGRASAAAENGTLYTAFRTSGRQGEATVTLKSVKPDPKVKGTWRVSGQYRVRMPPAGGGKTGEVVIEVRF